MTIDPLEHEILEVDEDEVDNDFIGQASSSQHWTTWRDNIAIQIFK